MKNYQIGQRVVTCFGGGLVVDFEHFSDGGKCVFNDRYSTFCRVGVVLDNPSHWACFKNSNRHPYFTQSELMDEVSA